MGDTGVRSIYQRMAAATAEITAVAKNLSVGYGRSSYKAVGEADVLAAVRRAEQNNGIYSNPIARDIVDSGTMTNRKADGSETNQLYMRIRTVYRFVNIDRPDEYIEVVGYGDGVDSQDKAPGKAMTYSDKYCLLKAYKIVTGEDPDQYASQQLQGVQSGSYQQPVYQQQQAPPAPVPQQGYQQQNAYQQAWGQR